MLQITTTTKMQAAIKNNLSMTAGFTLFELVVVMAVISVMIMVAVPYASKSNDGLKLKQEGLNIAEAIKYAIDLAINSGKSVRITIDTKNKEYLLEAASAENTYRPLDGFLGAACYISQTTRIVDMTGFETDGSNQYLVFAPAKQWPQAEFSLSAGDIVETIRIKGKKIEVEESTI
jgi:prepilin-type N-terminal cleavage/methylation domain-containing protein